MKLRHLIGFSLYDFANSGYVIVFQSFFFPIFYKEVVLGAASTAELWWGIALSVSAGAALLLGPVVGHISDQGRRKRILGLTIGITIIGIIAASWMHGFSPVVYTALFVATNLFFTLTQVIYDSFLPHIATKPGESAVTSSFSWGFGYLGGLACLSLVALVQGSTVDPHPLGLLVTGVFFAVFSVAALKLLPHQNIIQTAMFSVRHTWDHIRSLRIGHTLLAIWLLNEAISVFMFFGILFARQELSVTIRDLVLFLLLIEFIAFPATWLFGLAAKRYGIVRVVLVTVVIWGVVIIGAVSATTVVHFKLLALIGASVMGSTQALLRAYYSQRVALEHSGLGFSFYAIAARSSAVVGPLLFGIVSTAFASLRIALLSTLPFFIAGMAMLLYADRKKDRVVAVEE